MLVAGTILDGRYEIVEPLAEGGMGAVFRARRRLLGDEVALKIVRSDLGADPAARERFLREGRACAQLRHPNIVSILDYNLDAEGRPFLVMELLNGRSLRQEIGRARIAAGRRGPGDHRSALQRPAARARPGAAPSRSEAGQHRLARFRRRDPRPQDRGLRPGARAVVRFDAAHRRAPVPRHLLLCLARADSRRRRRRPVGSVQPGGRDLRAADRAPAVRRAGPGAARERAPHQATARAEQRAAGPAEVDRRRARARAGEVAGGPLRLDRALRARAARGRRDRIARR